MIASISFPPSTAVCFAMFALGAIPANLLSLWMARIVRSKGLQFGMWNFQVPQGVANFVRVLRSEPDVGRRSTYKFVFFGFVLSVAWCLVWFVGFIHSGRSS